MTKKISMSVGINSLGCFIYLLCPLVLYAFLWWIKPEILMMVIVCVLWLVIIVIYEYSKVLIYKLKNKEKK